ncbi:AAA family ATPase [Paenibacillus macquariensis]|uniref:MoxR-like ATPase n=2 Tax=Paenibacillus macquariensis TaxID=948756 RepID=A0ABY1KBR7_9BACL|nr:MoxR family ATPase [Paenibacillus macquariensis]MEC0093564.1 MoxR family ATPase [Paenibacillus macquariensis]SIR56437.1 MoxR-like ATPase [Paenibacillus macquariensis]
MLSTPSMNHKEFAPDLIDRMISRVSTVMIGKESEIRLVLMSMLSGGHVLLEDVPGVGKTMLVRTIAACMGGSFGRIQFTYDLMPSDITGISVYHPHTGHFEFRPGPILSNVVLADEINRASPRTQSALLEAMEERKVTVDGSTYLLPRPFLLLATQNPLQFEGTYRLPEAQLDRFLIRLSLGYPSPEQEINLLSRMQSNHPLDQVRPVIMAEEMEAMQRDVKNVFVDDSIKHLIVSVADESRRHPRIQLGISPRGSLSWMVASQAAAYMNGRMYVTPDDIKDTAVAVLSHRIVIHARSLMEGISGEELVVELMSRISVPPYRSRRGSRL